MTCYYPITGMKSRTLSKNGKRTLTFDPAKGFADMPMTINCGKCIGCKMDYARGWAIRCMHEAEYHAENMYITLTYNNENLPPGGTLALEDFQMFMKRLRHRFEPQQIRFYHSGEYGSKYGRPHYHALIFGAMFYDLVFLKMVNEIPLFKSEELELLWGNGYASVGSVTMASAAYVARYIMKKTYPDKRDEGQAHWEKYTSIDRETGECFPLKPEYCTMSLKPGIGAKWFETFKRDVYPSDFITYQGRKYKPPKYYDRLYESDHPVELLEIKQRRLIAGKKHSKDNTLERLRVRERVKMTHVERLPRNLDED